MHDFVFFFQSLSHLVNSYWARFRWRRFLQCHCR